MFPAIKIENRILSSETHFLVCTMSSFVFKGKMVIVGDIAVGKTSLASRFVEDKFPKNHIASVGGSECNLRVLYSCILYKNSCCG